MSQLIKSAGEIGGARCSGQQGSLSASVHGAEGVRALPANVIAHPNFDGPVVVNTRWPGPKPGVVNLCRVRVALYVLDLDCIFRHHLTHEDVSWAHSEVMRTFGSRTGFELVQLAAVARELENGILSRERPRHRDHAYRLRKAAALAVLITCALESFAAQSSKFEALLTGPLRSALVRAAAKTVIGRQQ
ncbi:MAG: hypothetical protein U1F53_06790 [Burkholderiaceae bacterium]